MDDKTREFFAMFDFDEVRHLVKYKSDRDLGDEIDKAIEAHESIDDCYEEYEDFVGDIMTLVGVEWEIVPCRNFTL